MEKPDNNNLTTGNLWANIWHMSWPMLGIMVFNFFVGLADVYVAGLISPEVQAAVGFVSQIYFLSIIVANALSIGTLAIVSRAMGAGVFVISLMSVAVFVLAGYLASMSTDSQDVLKETAIYLRFNMLSEPFMAMSAILGGGLQGAGDTKGTMWIIIAAMWIVRLPLAFFLAIILGYGAVGVWTAMITSMALQGLLMSLRFYRGHWKIIKVG